MAHEDSEDFAALLAEYDGQTPNKRSEPQVGDKVTGRVVSIGRDNVFIDLGAKSEGTIELDQLKDGDGRLTVAVGDEIEASVASKDDRTGSLILRSRLGGRGHVGSDVVTELEQAHGNGLPVEGLVTAVNKGGVEVQVGGVRCFCPMSQLDNKFVEDAQAFVGRRLAFRVTRFEGGRNPNIVLSRRALLEEEQRERAETTRARLAVGAVMPGIVTSIKSYGAFVDLGGIEGMLHVSELSFGRVGRPEELLAPGQEVEVAVLKIEKTGDPKRPEKISLSLRALQDDPWRDLESRFSVGSRHRGVVSRLQPFGAFVELAPGVEGLVHISELGAGRRVNHPKEVVSAGDTVEVTVLAVEPDKRRIGLSIGKVKADDDAAEEREAFRSYGGNQGQSLGTFGDLLQKSLKK
jgi:small subunit ribosomal protein S1